MTRPDPRLADRNWRWSHSKWLLGPILGFGTITVFSLLYAGRKLKDPTVTRVALALGIPTAFVWIVIGTSHPDQPDRPVDNVAGFMTMAIWIGGIVYGVLLNRRMLLAKVQGLDGPWYQQHSQPSGVPAWPAAPMPQSGWTGTLGLDQVQQQAFAAAPPPTYAPPPPPPTYAPPALPPVQPPPAPAPPTAARPPAGTPVDVNNADEAALRTLPGVGPALAKRILAHRKSTGGLRSPEDLAAAGVPPHVLAGLLGAVNFGPGAPQTPRGRVLDL